MKLKALSFAVIGALALTAVGASDVMAQVGVGPVTDALDDAGTGIGTIGTAMLAAGAAGIAIKWILGFMF